MIFSKIHFFSANDSRSFTSCGGDRQVYLWDTVTGRIIRQYQGHHLKINALSFNEDSSVLASGSDDKTVRLWDMRSRESRYPIQILDEARDSIGSVFIKRTSIAVGSIDGCVRVYDIRKGVMTADNLTGKTKFINLITSFLDAVTSVKLNSDSQCYLASLMNSTVQLVDGPSGKILNTFKGHEQVKYRLESCFTADESTVVSGSEDSMIYLWDLVDGKVKKTLKGHEKAVVSLAAHPKINSILLSASSDGTIKLWE